jgi:hypothetical protein
VNTFLVSHMSGMKVHAPRAHVASRGWEAGLTSSGAKLTTPTPPMPNPPLARSCTRVSDIPIKFQRPLRKRMLKASKMKSARLYVSLLNGLSFSDLAPQATAVAEFSTGEIGRARTQEERRLFLRN